MTRFPWTTSSARSEEYIYFDDIKPGWNKSLGKLEDEYYGCFRHLKTDNIGDLWTRALEKKPKLSE